MQITFLGATGTVTGSKYLIEVENQKILVDCGLFQGYKNLRLRNWAPLPIDPASIDAVVLTHAHIDHTGYLPLLGKLGFTGQIYATKATKELCSILLTDSGHLQEEDAKRANKYGYSKHKPALPLYTKADALTVLKQFQTEHYDTYENLFEGLSLQFQRAGHILGSSFVKLGDGSTTLLFTGDMGRTNDPVMKPPSNIESVDYLVLESTYGNRLHTQENSEDMIANIINQTAKRGGTVIIPAFAVGRAQTLLYYIDRLKQTSKIPNLPVYLDSPMAVNATNILCNNSDEHKLSPDQCKSLCGVATYVNSVDDSKAIDAQRIPQIIISASGMATGGRVVHHLKAFISDWRNTVLFTGYQAGGTRGARLMQGEKEIKMHGQIFPVKAQIEVLSNTSAHADYQEILNWLKKFSRPPRTVFITHGEPDASQSLKEKIENELGWHCVIPEYLQMEDL